jgi:hypothetical protein
VADFERRNPEWQIVPDAMRWTMKVKTKIKAGGTPLNHNEVPARDTTEGLKVRTGIKAGGQTINHNEVPARDARKPQGLKVRTGVKAGGLSVNHNEALTRDRLRA